MEEHTKSRKPFGIAFVIIVVLAVGFVIAGFSIKVPYTVEVGKEVQEPYEAQEPYEVQEPYEAVEYYYETEPYTDRECESKKLSYKSTIDEVNRITRCTKDHQECQNYFLGVCTEWKTICDEYTQDCRFSVTNLDSESGSWRYKWSTKCVSPGCKCIDTRNLNQEYSIGLVEPTETKEAWAQIVYKPEHNQYCYATITYIPTKQVCRDVTKYKEVQKTRTVTKYQTKIQKETVTKYRTLFEEWFG